MNPSILQRFQIVIDTLAKGNRSEFARMTGKKPSHITDICKGRTSLTMQYLITLKTEFDISIHWLLVGEGEMMSSSSTEEEEDFVHVPVYDVHASAGYGSLIHSEQIVDHLAFKKTWLSQDLSIAGSELALVTVKGDSMEPTLEEGDLILVDLIQNEVQRDGIYLIQFDGALLAKRIQRDYDKNIHIISDNPLYKEFVLVSEQTNQVKIVGKVVWFGRRT